MSNVVTELLARCGEAACLDALMDGNLLESGTDIPSVAIRYREIDGDKDAVFCFDDEPRRLAYVPGFDWMWYNSEGPEE